MATMEQAIPLEADLEESAEDVQRESKEGVPVVLYEGVQIREVE
jgi:hypothetical protein